jgi:hypothetical protein
LCAGVAAVRLARALNLGRSGAVRATDVPDRFAVKLTLRQTRAPRNLSCGP